MKRAFGILLRLFCYPALLIVGAGFVALVIVTASGVCPRFDSGQITCITPRYKGLAEFAMAVTLASAFTGFPLLAAAGGLLFLVRDLRRWRARRAARSGVAG